MKPARKIYNSILPGEIRAMRHVVVKAMLRAAAVVVIAFCLGCASTTIHYSHTKPDGEVIDGSYTSSKNIEAEVGTNGTIRIRASASEATDANTRLLKQATDSAIQLGEFGASKVK